MYIIVWLQYENRFYFQNKVFSMSKFWELLNIKGCRENNFQICK